MRVNGKPRLNGTWPETFHVSFNKLSCKRDDVKLESVTTIVRFTTLISSFTPAWVVDQDPDKRQGKPKNIARFTYQGQASFKPAYYRSPRRRIYFPTRAHYTTLPSLFLLFFIRSSFRSSSSSIMVSSISLATCFVSLTAPVIFVWSRSTFSFPNE